MTTIEMLKTSMLKHWAAGKREDEFHNAVRGECPDASLQEYNDAADAAWPEIFGVGEVAR